MNKNYLKNSFEKKQNIYNFLSDQDLFSPKTPEIENLYTEFMKGIEITVS